MEVTGFIAMFFLFPWGLLAGAVLVFFGWRRSNVLVCTSCRTPVKNRDAEICPRCRARLGRE